jgi:hypothetical protein
LIGYGAGGDNGGIGITGGSSILLVMPYTIAGVKIRLPIMSMRNVVPTSIPILVVVDVFFYHPP